MHNIYKGQISESRRLAVLLALSGGLMDAYTYIFRGQVFANAQTGNILLFGVNLSEGNFGEALRYFFPVDSETAADVRVFDYIEDDPSYLPEQPGKPPPLITRYRLFFSLLLALE